MVRLPKSDNKSLRAWSAVDELLTHMSNEQKEEENRILFFNDRFGYLAKHSDISIIDSYIDNKSQLDSIKLNLQNHKENKTINYHYTKQTLNHVDRVIINCPKSLDMLEYYIQLANEFISPKGTILIGFMTKYFTPKYLDICKKYFQDVSQSKALKKARVITAKEKLPKSSLPLASYKVELPNLNITLNQLSGVFSKYKIDYATQFLIENIIVQAEEKVILDLGSGNGIISYFINQKYKHRELHLLDDSYMAHCSGKLNLTGDHIYHHWHYDLTHFKANQFDLIITNPPFHFGHEIDLSIPLKLVAESVSYLRKGGRLVIVSNNHINYTSQLEANFSRFNKIATNGKFNIWEAYK